MRAEIITIGDELCRGEIIDTNSAWLAEKLWELQVTVHWMSSCRDAAEDMAEILQKAANRSHLVLISGGLGPTSDDLTVDVVAEQIGAAAEVDEPSAERVKRRFAAAGLPLVDNVLRQVRVPAGARVYRNPAGLAPAFEVSLGSAAVICLPGPPRELQAIFESALRDRITKLRADRGENIEHLARRIYRVFGTGESNVAARLESLPLRDGATIHYQVRFPETLVKIVVRDRDAESSRLTLDSIDADIRSRLDALLYGVDDDSLAQAVGRELLARQQTLATAESCTGGLLGALVTDAPGSSAYFVGGVVAYANSEKTRQLGVREQTLDEFGAVSRECVLEMAHGARERLGTDVAVAISGVAGPGGGTEDKPVGTVWIAVAARDGFEHAKRYLWPGDRDRVRTLAAYWALNMVRRHLRGELVMSEER